jgi:hypothetical protein
MPNERHGSARVHASASLPNEATNVRGTASPASAGSVTRRAASAATSERINGTAL